MKMWWLFLLAGVSAYVCTGLLRRYAIGCSMLDVPNERSSHSVATPRGGGLAIVVAFVGGLSVLATLSVVQPHYFYALLGAGSWVAIIGFIDDHRHIPAFLRLLAHFIGAAWVLAWLGGGPAIMLLGNSFDLGWAGDLMAVFYLVWLLNLYNFMDGIDGIAAIEALSVCLGGVVLLAVSPASNNEMMPVMLLLVSVTGFLFWNFPRAKIFMGDAGSGFIGIVLGVFSFKAAWADPSLFWGWLILLGAFVVDATVTLVRRIIRGDRFFEAHRSHAYQYASRLYGSHVRISIMFMIINVFWLLPIAVLVAAGRLDGLAGVTIAYFPLMALAVYFKAGARELQEL